MKYTYRILFNGHRYVIEQKSTASGRAWYFSHFFLWAPQFSENPACSRFFRFAWWARRTLRQIQRHDAEEAKVRNIQNTNFREV